MKSFFSNGFSLAITFSLLLSVHPHLTADDSDLLKSLLPSSCVNSSDFTQTKTLKAIPNPILSSGHLFFSCNDGLIWQTEKPFTDILIYSNKNIQIKSTDGENFTVLNNLAHSYLGKLLNNLLKADTAALTEDFTITKMENGGVSLTPKNSQVAKSILAITIQRQNSNPDTNIFIGINNTNGQQLTLELSNHQNYSSSEINSSCEKIAKHSKVCEALINAELLRNASGI